MLIVISCVPVNALSLICVTDFGKLIVLIPEYANASRSMTLSELGWLNSTIWSDSQP